MKSEKREQLKNKSMNFEPREVEGNCNWKWSEIMTLCLLSFSENCLVEGTVLIITRESGTIFLNDYWGGMGGVVCVMSLYVC